MSETWTNGEVSEAGTRCTKERNIYKSVIMTVSAASGFCNV